MALSANTVWEVRDAGSDTNGGGFVIGASGTDWSQQNAAQYSLTNGVTDGSTTILTASAATDMVGNLVYVSGGTGGVSASWYQIMAASAGVSITVDRSTGLTAGTGVTLHIGGAIASLTALAAGMPLGPEGQAAWSKGTIDVPSDVTLAASSTDGTVITRIQGYGTTRGDTGRATLRATSSCTTLLRCNGWAWSFSNLILDANDTANNAFWYSGGYGAMIRNCKATGYKSYGLDGGDAHGLVALECEVTDSSASAISGIRRMYFTDTCWVHDNSGIGVTTGSTQYVVRSIITNNTGDGIRTDYDHQILQNTIHGNGGHGVNYVQVYGMGLSVRGNIITNNGGYGLRLGSTTQIGSEQWGGNAYYGNSSGARSPSAGTPPNDITLTGLPYTDESTDDYSLNNIAGEGAACRAVGSPVYLDIGALQHQDSGGAGGMLYAPGMSGGME